MSENKQNDGKILENSIDKTKLYDIIKIQTNKKFTKVTKKEVQTNEKVNELLKFKEQEVRSNQHLNLTPYYEKERYKPLA